MGGDRRVAIVLFLCLFAAQSSLLVLSPILEQVSADLGVSTAAAGQLRTVTGLVGGLAAAAIVLGARRLTVRPVLAGGLAALAAGAALSALAPTFVVLALAQVPVGLGLAGVLCGAVAAAGEWTAPEHRPTVLAVALLGQPSAWVLGMPVAGLVAHADWRLAYLAVPLVASLVALSLVLGRRFDEGTCEDLAARPRAWRAIGVRGWVAGEVLAFAGWGGTLVYAGAVLTESYGLSAGAAGLLLGLAALGYFPGSLAARRLVVRDLPLALAALALGSAVVVAAFGLVRPAAWVTTILFALCALVVAGRTLAGSALGLELEPTERIALMGLRAAATQFGYLLGALLGGVAIATGGFAAMGIVLGALLAGAAVPHALAAHRDRAGAASRLPTPRVPRQRAPGKSGPG